MSPSLRLAGWLCLATLVVGACAGPTASGATSAGSGLVSAAPSVTTNVTSMHEAPALEARLPAAVAGRPLARWSLAGPDLLRLVAPGMDINALQAAAAASSQAPIDLTHLQYAVAGRSNTTTDPPYFVFAVARPPDDDEITIALMLLFGGAGYKNPIPPQPLQGYEPRTIAGKPVLVGTADMVAQGEHQRGRPYLYQTDTTMFIVLTDDDTWAQDALSQLP